ncbi:MAG: type II toxin-antitoxin system VapB family antitoxin [Fimbriimonas sp.]
MSLNIKDEATVDLITRAAKATGKTKTAVVREAVSRYLDKVEKPPLADRLMEIGRQCAAAMSEETRTMDIDEWLYDEHGMPK